MIIALCVELDDTAASVTPPNGTAPMLVKVQPEVAAGSRCRCASEGCPFESWVSTTASTMLFCELTNGITLSSAPIGTSSVRK